MVVIVRACSSNSSDAFTALLVMFLLQLYHFLREILKIHFVNAETHLPLPLRQDHLETSRADTRFVVQLFFYLRLPTFVGAAASTAAR